MTQAGRRGREPGRLGCVAGVARRTAAPGGGQARRATTTRGARRAPAPYPHVRRRRRRRADAGLRAPGYGKTTAVRAWCAASATAWAWVTLDGHDNDPARLWTYAATAVDRVREGLGRRALQRLRVAGMPVEIAVDELMNGIAAYGRELALVLDDCHAVTNGECLASLRYAVERLPPNGRLILLTRADPQIGLAELRARGTLAELRASELAFTRSEARELLVVRGGLRLRAGCGRSDETDRRLAGGVYLAALWLRTVSDHPRAVAGSGGPSLRRGVSEP